MNALAYNPGVRDFLLRLGARPEVIEYIDGLDDSKLQGKLANEVRKRPDIGLEELEVLERSQQKSLPDPEVERVVEELSFSGMLPDDLRKPYESWWRAQAKSEKRLNSDLWQRLICLAETDDFQEGDYIYDELVDWVREELPDLRNFNLKQAFEECDRWHYAMSMKGAGLYYDKTGKVVYQFSDGWTIREVKSENDLNVEGNLMGHCVASYINRVASGESVIFSLRDHSNKPHATVELGPGAELKQVSGKQNKEPVEKHRERLGEWLRSIGASIHSAVYFESSLEEATSLKQIINLLEIALAEAPPTIMRGADPKYGLSVVTELVFSGPREHHHRIIIALVIGILRRNSYWYRSSPSTSSFIFHRDGSPRFDELRKLINLIRPWFKLLTPSPATTELVELVAQYYVQHIDLKRMQRFSAADNVRRFERAISQLIERRLILPQWVGLDQMFVGGTSGHYAEHVEWAPGFMFIWALADALGLPVHRPFADFKEEVKRGRKR